MLRKADMYLAVSRIGKKLWLQFRWCELLYIRIKWGWWRQDSHWVKLHMEIETIDHATIVDRIQVTYSANTVVSVVSQVTYNEN